MPPNTGPRRTAASRIVNAFVVVAILAIAVVGFVLLRATGPQAPGADAQEREWRVATQPLEWRDQAAWFTAFGQVESPSRATLAARTEGDVVRVAVRAGQIVAAGDLLVELDPRDAADRVVQLEGDRAEQDAARAIEEQRAATDQRARLREQEQVEIAQRALERIRDLNQRQLSSENEVDQARNTLEQARLRVEQRQQAIADAPARIRQIEARIERIDSALALARRNLAASRVIASQPARVIDVPVSVGERVRANDPLIELFPLDDVEIRATLPEKMLPSVRAALTQDAPVFAFLDDPRTNIRDEYNAASVATGIRLVRLAASVAPGEAGRGAYFSIDPTLAGEMALGGFVRLRVRLPERHDVAAIPREALHGADRIYTVNDQRLRAVAVERLGEAADPANILIRPLDSASPRPDRVVVTRLPNAIDGLRVSTANTTTGDTPLANSNTIEADVSPDAPRAQGNSEDNPSGRSR